MIAGLDVLAEGCAREVAAFCKTYNVPLITTYKAKGILPESDPLALGGAGLSPLADRTLVPFVQSADLVLLAGYDPVEMRAGWREVWDVEKQRVIEIGAEANRHHMHRSGLEFVAGIAPSLDRISQGITPRETWPAGEVAKARRDCATSFAPEPDWGPGAVFEECRKALPPDALVSADSGAHRILLSQMWTCEQPRTLVQSSAFCTMARLSPLSAMQAC